MTERLRWPDDAKGWPNAEASRFVEAGGLRWHVQAMGAGPVVLLLHGAGASTHSWRAVAPRLASRFTVIAPDLPGHGFTAEPPPRGATLPGMAAGVGALLRAIDAAPDIVVGHSAGAAIALRMALDGLIAPRGVVSFNGALTPFPGLAGALFPQIAKLLFINPFTPRLFAWRAGDENAVRRVIENTGSRLDDEGVRLYSRLFRSPGHVAGALGMMANWDLAPLLRDLPALRTRLTLVVGGADKAVPPDDAFRIRDLTPGAVVEVWRGLGHLAHEEEPQRAADLILAAADSVASSG
ncbi:MAG: alpha/beta fold hydrolase [Hyphomicrobiales bacterium]|nr:alpha/beta fold hydrolase [Hyphomicrobiales bacterium]